MYSSKVRSTRRPGASALEQVKGGGLHGVGKGLGDREAAHGTGFVFDGDARGPSKAKERERGHILKPMVWAGRPLAWASRAAMDRQAFEIKREAGLRGSAFYRRPCVRPPRTRRRGFLVNDVEKVLAQGL